MKMTEIEEKTDKIYWVLFSLLVLFLFFAAFCVFSRVTDWVVFGNLFGLVAAIFLLVFTFYRIALARRQKNKEKVVSLNAPVSLRHAIAFPLSLYMMCNLFL